MNSAASIMLGLAIIILGGLNFYQHRTIDGLRAELKTERDNQLSKMQDTLNALQLVQKYQSYLKEKGIPLP
jgi:predicted DNA-binding helix-hairpin-helix protein